MTRTNLIYLNNATLGFPVCPAAEEAFIQSLHSAPTDIRHSRRGSSVEQSRRRLAASMGVESEQVVFQPSVTYGINAVIRGTLVPDAHVVVDNRAHNSILRTLANTPGTLFTIARLHTLDESLNLPALENAFKRETRMVALTAVSNVTGSVYDVGSIIRHIRRIRPDVTILVDAAQAAGLVDLGPSLEADFTVFGAYKYLHALPGVAVLVARRPLLPFIFGGTGTNSATLRVEDLPNAPLEVGTPNEPAVAALTAAWEDASDHRTQYRERNRELAYHLLVGATRTRGVRVLGRPANAERIAILGLVTECGHVERDWVPYLESQGIIVRGGLHCSPSIHEDHCLLAGGTLRLSASRFTATSDIDAAWDAIGDFASSLAALETS
ncbi:MAG: aminotransferase class V-fold PLP-dependent enzyme [Planctomycetes bacterium]|nr:aminotransferase class V-fold PLP-dependent enzyme [Planctomycetota bacterium]